MLSRNAIRTLMSAHLIQVTPAPVNIGPNSIDLRLGDKLYRYGDTGRVPIIDPVSKKLWHAIDPKNPPALIEVPLAHEGKWLLVPGQFYLGVTLEETFCKGVVPHLDGRSTCGRLSIEAHKTAGVGDNGFRGRWTLEIEVTEPVLVAPGDRLIQMYFTPCWGAGLAHVIRVTENGSSASCQLNPEDPLFVDLIERTGDLGWTQVTHTDPLLELNDLYGGEKAHYRSPQDVQGAAPLD